MKHLQVWADERQYQIEYEKNDWYGDVKETNDFVSPAGIKTFMDKITRTGITPREYQYRAVYEAIKYNRKLLLSPTGSGKSLMIYSLVRYYTATNKKTLIIVPTTSLVEQMVNDFNDYGWNADDHVHKIYSGKDKNTDKPIIISTWQSIYKFPKRYFDDIDCVIGDEAHLFKSKSLTGIMTKAYTMPSIVLVLLGHLTVARHTSGYLEGLFGDCERVTKTDDLIKSGYLSLSLGSKCCCVNTLPNILTHIMMKWSILSNIKVEITSSKILSKI